MSYKIPHIPSPKSHIEELADYWEVLALLNPDEFISSINVLRPLSKSFDEIIHDGIQGEDDHLSDRLDGVFMELVRRQTACNGKYPFKVGTNSIQLWKEESIAKTIYIYLLLCTRLSMESTGAKFQNGIDGTQVFERLCAVIGQKYFGDNADCLVFGTASGGSFESKVKDLVSKIGEGDGFKNLNSNKPTKQDDCVDVVVWKGFSDKRPGKIIGFGQCKTGTGWRSNIQKLNPDDFCDSWFMNKPIVPLIPIVFLCDTLNYESNFVTDQRGRLFFNRFRIMEFLPEDIGFCLLNDIQSWVDKACQTQLLFTS